MRVIISDTSPLRYLILIGADFLLPRLYQQVVIPQYVQAELQAAVAPGKVKEWFTAMPAWLEILPSLVDSRIVSPLDLGERHAISLALQLQADLVLMDDRAGVIEARRLGLTVSGTLGVLVQGSERGWIDLPQAIAELLKTNFRASPRLIQQILLAHPERRKNS